MRDLATILGRQHAASIHNVYIAACDLEGRVSAAEIRKHFPNATNIVHAQRGKAGYQPMFYDAIVNHSSQIEPLYETQITTAEGQIEFEVSTEPKAGARKLFPYIAEVFVGDGTEPSETRIAGRELLDSSGLSRRKRPSGLEDQRILKASKVVSQ